MESVIKARIGDAFIPSTASPTYDRQIFLKLLVLSTLFKLALAATIPLGLDEAYATAVAREYSLSFFEHPAIGFWLPVLSAHLSGIEATLIYRLPFLLLGIGTTWMMFLIGREIGGSRTGVLAAILYTVAPFFLLSSGVFVVPDGPLNFASAVVVLMLVRITRAEGRAPIRWWIYAGGAMALALGSKYQAAWLPIAVLLFMITHPTGRRWFLQPGVYLAGLIGLLGLVPVVLWNMEHDWITLRFHMARVNGGVHPEYFLLMLALQMLFLLPSGLAFSALGLWGGLRARANAPLFLLAIVALGPIVFFNYVNISSTDAFAHWSMPGWLFALPLAAWWLKGRKPVALHRIWLWMVWPFAVVWAVLLALVLQSDTGLLTRPFYDRPPAWDNTMALFDYGGLKPALKARGLWRTTDVFMANSWAFGGILDTAMASEKPMRIFDRQAAHHFTFLSDATATGTTLFMEPSLLPDTTAVSAAILKSARTLDANATLLAPLILRRGGQPYVSVSLVRLTLK